MANSDKNILVTPSVGLSTNPTIKFNGANNTPTTLRVLDDGTVSFEGTAGQLFSISDGLTGSIFSVNDISGIPSIEVLDTGLVKLNQYGGSTVFGASAAIQNGSAVNAKVSISTVSATTPGLIIKSVASQSANLQEWQNSAGSILASLNQYGTLTVGGNLIVSTYTALGASTRGTEKLFVLSTSASEPAAVFKAAASQTADLQQWQNSAGTVLANITSEGRLKLLTNSEAYATLQSTAYSAGAHAARFKGAGGASVLRLETVANNTIGLEVIGAYNQTSNLQEWQNYTGTALAKVDASGNITAPSVNLTIPTSSATPAIVAKGESTYGTNIAEFRDTGNNLVTRINGYGSLITSSLSVGPNPSSFIGFSSTTASIKTLGANFPGLVVQGATSQTANLQEWQNSSGTNVAFMRGDGLFSSYWGYHTYIQPQSGTGSYIYLTNNGIKVVGYTTVSNIVFSVQGMSGQTGDLQQWQNSSGTALSSITNNGFLNTPAILENPTISATAATGTINYDLLTNKSVTYYTSNASANWTLNIRGNSSTTLDSLMAVGQSLTIAFLVTQGSTAYYQSGLQIDGTSVTPKWQGGVAPTFGNASGVDSYSITIMKTASATFTVFESQTRFA